MTVLVRKVCHAIMNTAYAQMSYLIVIVEHFPYVAFCIYHLDTDYMEELYPQITLRSGQSAGGQGCTIAATIVDDTIVEDIEDLFVSLNGGVDEPVTVIPPSVATVNILQDPADCESM